MTLKLYAPGKPDQIYMSHNPVMPDRCAVEVNRPRGAWSFWAQCSGPAKFERVIGGQTVKVCNTHRPEVVQARNAAKNERGEAKMREWRRGIYRPAEYRDALRAIAAGDNDPRATAREALAKWDDLPEDGQ